MRKEKQRFIRLCVAGLELNLIGTGAPLTLSVPPAHKQFLDDCEEFLKTHPSSNLQIQSKSIPPVMQLAECIFKTEIYEIYQEPSGGFIFYSPRQVPPRLILIDQNFSQGEVIGDFSILGNKPFYPLQYTDIIFFANWLAGFGDLILHASGVAVNGKGYCFAGQSGVGKSTLALALAQQQNVTILGEDQVILRYLAGRFWIFGTPWHESPDRCSPLGVPLKKLYFPVRQEENRVKEISRPDGFKRLMTSAFIPYYRPDAVDDIMGTLNTLAERIPFREISYKLGSDLLPFID